MVRRNLTISFFSASVKIIGGIGLVSVLARVFSLADFGDFTYALTVGTVFGLLVDYGYNIKIVKDVSSGLVAVNKIVYKTLIGKILLLLLATLLFFFVSNLKGDSTRLLITCLFLYLSLVAFSLTNTFLSVFKGRKEYIKDLKIVAVDNLLTFSIVIIVAYVTNDIQYTALGFFLSKLVSLVFTIFIYYKNDTISKSAYKEVLGYLFSGLPYAIHYWVGNLYLNIDTIIMKPMVTSESMGIYQSGIRIVIGLGILLTVINSVYLPLLNEHLYKNKEKFADEVLKLNINILRLSLLCVVAMIIFSKYIILLLFGEKFLELNEFFWILILIIGLRIIGSSYGILLTISNKQILRAIAGSISIVLIVVLNFIFIPIYGYRAAPYILLFAHIFITVFYITSIYLEHKTIYLPSLKEMFKLKLF